MTSLRRCAQANAPVASYWLRPALTRAGAETKQVLRVRGAGVERAVQRALSCCRAAVAKVRPSRYIRAGASLKLLAASKSTKFYKSPQPPSATPQSRRRVVFFVHGSAAAHCPCLQAEPPGRRSGVLVAGRLEQLAGGRRAGSRLVVTAALPLGPGPPRALVRRAAHLGRRHAELCQRRRTERRRAGRPGPDQSNDDEKDEEQVQVGEQTRGRRREERRRARVTAPKRVVNAARRPGKRRLQQQQQQQQNRNSRRRQRNER